MEFTELQKHWQEFGKTDPLWAILSQPDKKKGGWDPVEFFRLGRKEVDAFMAHANQLGHMPHWESALDFGCGVGRLTQALCRHFNQCFGIDIASSMVDQARKFNIYGERCHYVVNETTDLRCFKDDTFDLVYSNIVLQHMEPRYSKCYIQEFIRVLKPGGVTYFQLASEPDEMGTQDCPAVPMAEFQAKVTLLKAQAQFTAGKSGVVRVRVQNTSQVRWPGRGRMRVRLGNHWRAQDGTVLVWDDGRKDIPHDMKPGEQCVLDLRVTPPDVKNALLEVDLLQEHVVWFQDHGTEIAKQAATIEPAHPEVVSPEDFDPVMELYGVPVDEVKQLLDEAGADLIEAQEDGWSGPDWLSYHYVAVKR